MATFVLAGTAMLGALGVALDYAMKFTGAKDIMSTPWRLAFPYLGFLKFDLTGVPIFCAMAFFGLASGGATAAIVGVAITLRGGVDLVGGSMKALAEFSTMVGAYVALGKLKWRKWVAAFMGPVVRAAFMCIANIIVVPLYYQVPFGVVLSWTPLIALFNIIQGCITVYLGLLVVEAVLRRASHLLPRDAPALSWPR